jgi:hypothetical protein
VSAAIQRVGLLPPLVTVYQEQVRVTAVQELVRREDWTHQAAENLQRAFADELASAHQAAAAIAGEEREIGELADLFGAFDLSVRRHAYGEMDEEFPERAGSFDYSLGSAAELMERQRIDAVWIVAGANLVPTTGAQASDAIDVLLAVVAALGRAPAMTTVLEKLELRAALVARNGDVLFFCRLRAGDVASSGDLRQPEYARSVVRRVLAEYQTATAP